MLYYVTMFNNVKQNKRLTQVEICCSNIRCVILEALITDQLTQKPNILTISQMN